MRDEHDVIAGRALHGGPAAEPSDFSPPAGTFVVGFLDGVPACGGGVEALGDGAGEIKRMYVVGPRATARSRTTTTTRTPITGARSDWNVD